MNIAFNPSFVKNLSEGSKKEIEENSTILQDMSNRQTDTISSDSLLSSLQTDNISGRCQDLTIFSSVFKEWKKELEDNLFDRNKLEKARCTREYNFLQ